MSEKRDAPLSLRLGKDREARFASYRQKTKQGQSEALHRLIDRGLDAEGFGASQTPAKPKRTLAKAKAPKGAPASPKPDPRWVI